MTLIDDFTTFFFVLEYTFLVLYCRRALLLNSVALNDGRHLSTGKAILIGTQAIGLPIVRKIRQWKLMWHYEILARVFL